MSTGPLQFQICRASSEKQKKLGIKLLVTGTLKETIGSEAAEMWERVEQGELDLSNLLLILPRTATAISSNTVCAAGLLVAQPDRTGILWPPVVKDLEDQPEADANEIMQLLLAGVTELAQKNDCTHIQVALPMESEFVANQLGQADYKELGKMKFLQRTTLHSLSTNRPEPSERPVLIPYRDIMDDHDLATLIEKTYQQSNDYPELQSLRSGLGAIASHRTQGKYRPEWWYVIRVGEHSAGVLLLGDHPDFGQVELIYIGIVPAYRNRGLAKSVIENAGQHFKPPRPIFLGVDARNTYAVKLYDSLKFEEVATQRVFLRFLEL